MFLGLSASRLIRLLIAVLCFGLCSVRTACAEPLAPGSAPQPPSGSARAAKQIPVGSAAPRPGSARSNTVKGTERPSGASDDANIEMARRHFRRGVEFYNNGDYKLALIEFQRSYELSQNYRILYNIGQVNHQLGNYARALTALEAYLAQGGSDIEEARRAEVIASIRKLRGKTADIELSVNLDDVEVSVDDIVVGKVSHRRKLTVDAGEHRIELRKPGYQLARTSLTLAAGERKAVALSLKKQKPTVVVKSQTTTSPLLWAGWIATGAFAAGAGVTGGIAASQANDLANQRNTLDSSASERQNTAAQAKAFALASDALTAAAIVTGAASLYFTLKPSKRRNEEKPPTSTSQITIRPLGISFVHHY